ncbi:MAG TPA: FAD-dependent monooxygenase [Isosphaeraceae bacterium]|nr:FAD-dependent monooxygenase [Isosphaeraceae bacterium]
MSAGPSGSFDVAIAGAGLAGGALALLLARGGARVALLDACRFPRDKLCGEYLSPESWGALDRLGLSDAVAGSGYRPVRRLRLTTPRGRVLEADVVGPDGRPGIALGRSMLDDLLVRGALAAGARLFEGMRVGGPIVEGGRVVGLAARHPTEGPYEVRARWNVAADGRRSGLVRRSGVVRVRDWSRPRLVGLKRHVAVDDPDGNEPADTVDLHLVPGGYVGACRVEGALTNVCALLPESVPRRSRGDLDRATGEVFEANPALRRLWASSRPAGDWKTVANVRVEAATPRLGGIVYVGDAMGTVDPLGGQGMTMALLGAELLAPFLFEALAGRDGDDRWQPSYERAWHRRFERRIRLCRLFHHVLVHPALIDLATVLPRHSQRVLSFCFARTRDPQPS